jgi:hypothetical protein
LFETLTTISAEEASIPVRQVRYTGRAGKHVAFYLDVLEQNVRTQHQNGRTGARSGARPTVASEEGRIKTQLRDSHDRIKPIGDTAEWPSEDHIGGVLTIVHTAYHLGEIRQALCTIQP